MNLGPFGLLGPLGLLGPFGLLGTSILNINKGILFEGDARQTSKKWVPFRPLSARRPLAFLHGLKKDYLNPGQIDSNLSINFFPTQQAEFLLEEENQQCSTV